MSTITAGLLLPAGSNVSPEPIFVEDYKSIQNLVGGAFDAVRTDMGHDQVALVGYVHDEGMLIPLEYNYIATALFKQNIFGDCVVVWGLDENGVYDGENHDIPEFMVNFLSEELMESVANSYNLSSEIAYALEYAVEFGIGDEDEINMLMLTMLDNVSEHKSNHDTMGRILEIVEAVAKHSGENEEAAREWWKNLTEQEEG